MQTPDDRTAELIAAAAADALTPEEAAELDELRAADPAIDAEIDDLRRVGATLEGMSWIEPGATESLRDRILSDRVLSDRVLSDSASTDRALGDRVRTDRVRDDAAIEPAEPDAPERPAPPIPLRPHRARRWVLPATAAASLVLGLAVGAALPPLTSTPTGPPGTLGAIERIDVRDEPDGTAIDAELVAHTWGTEAILDATGLEPGETFTLVLIDDEGAEHSAGAMLGSTVEIHCRVNAAVLRADVVRMEVRGPGAQVIAAADLPTV